MAATVEDYPLMKNIEISAGLDAHGINLEKLVGALFQLLRDLTKYEHTLYIGKISPAEGLIFDF